MCRSRCRARIVAVAGALSSSVAGVTVPGLEPLTLPDANNVRADLVRVPKARMQRRIGRAVLQLIYDHRYAAPTLVNAVPGIADPRSRTWLPEIRTSVPPRGESVVASPRPWLTLEPVRLGSTNTMVAGSAETEGQVTGIVLRLPWRIP